MKKSGNPNDVQARFQFHVAAFIEAEGLRRPGREIKVVMTLKDAEPPEATATIEGFEVESERPAVEDNEKMLLAELPLHPRPHNKLIDAKIRTAGQLAKKTFQELRDIGLGKKTVEDIRAILTKLKVTGPLLED